MKEEERKWADEDNKADDVDVTLHLYQPSTRYMYLSRKKAENTSTWYLIPQQNIPHLPKWGASRSLGNDIIINPIMNTSRTQFLIKSIEYMFCLTNCHITVTIYSNTILVHT